MVTNVRLIVGEFREIGEAYGRCLMKVLRENGERLARQYSMFFPREINQMKGSAINFKLELTVI